MDAATENQELPRSNNASGFKMVHKVNDRFQLKVTLEGGDKQTVLGSFNTALTAAKAYARWKHDKTPVVSDPLPDVGRKPRTQNKRARCSLCPHPLLTPAPAALGMSMNVVLIL